MPSTVTQMVLPGLVIGVLCVLSVLVDIHAPCGVFGIAFAADVLKIDGLSTDPKQFRAQVDQLLNKTDSLIAKLKAKPEHEAIVLDLMQTRDDILREIPKIESSPGDAKWTANEMYESVQSKLKLLKNQYDKAAVLAI